MARSTCRAADGWPNAPTLRAPFSRWWESAATTASDISSPSHHAIGVSVERELSILPRAEFQLHIVPSEFPQRLWNACARSGRRIQIHSTGLLIRRSAIVE